jgi:aryl-alcohol dehydrogenase-like predicted oxidoreductase
LYQLHRLDPKVPAEETIGFLKEKQDQGYFRHFGISEVSVEDLHKVEGMITITSVQNLYNLAERRWEDVLDWCEERNIAFIPWYPLSAGGISTQQALKHVADRHGASEYQVAIAWLLARSKVMLPIPGTSSVKHLEENTASAALRLTDKDMQELSAAENKGK